VGNQRSSADNVPSGRTRARGGRPVAPKATQTPKAAQPSGTSKAARTSQTARDASPAAGRGQRSAGQRSGGQRSGGQRSGGQRSGGQHRQPAGPTSPVSGTFRPHPRGFGFLDLDAPAGPEGAQVTSAFVRPQIARTLLDADHVTCDVSFDIKGATVERVGRHVRRRTHVVGTLVTAGLQLDPNLGSGVVQLTGPVKYATARGKAGDTVAVVLTPGTALHAQSVIAGPVRASDTAAVSRVVAAVRAADPDALATSCPGVDAVIAAAQVAAIAADVELAGPAGNVTWAGTPVPGGRLPRRDLTSRTTVTVDGPSTKDLDDAVSAHVEPDGTVRVWVHIADVAPALLAGSDLDVHARTLATSTYMHGHVAPMLPRHLSEGTLSLLPGVRRETVSVSFAVSPDGGVSAIEPMLSTIVSDARITYERVQGIIDGAPDAADVFDETVRATVDAMLAAARALGTQRDARLTLQELFVEPGRAVGVDGRAVKVAATEPFGDAMQVIERLMVAANEAVAAWLTDAGMLAMFRVHAGINPERAAQLVAALERAGVVVEPDTAPTISQVRAGMAHREFGGMVSQAAADAMGRAGYQPAAGRHTGLDSGAYCHFTSPIRRYADVVVHRQLRAAMAGEQSPHDPDELEQIAAWVTIRSGAANRAESLQETLLWSRWCAQQLADDVPQIASAVVRRVTGAGLSVRLEDFGLPAFIPTALLSGWTGPVTPDDANLEDETGTWRVGDRISVRLASVTNSGQVEVSPVRPRARSTAA
jgi:ribonuclease R